MFFCRVCCCGGCFDFVKKDEKRKKERMCVCVYVSVCIYRNQASVLNRTAQIPSVRKRGRARARVLLCSPGLKQRQIAPTMPLAIIDNEKIRAGGSIVGRVDLNKEEDGAFVALVVVKTLISFMEEKERKKGLKGTWVGATRRVQ